MINKFFLACCIMCLLSKATRAQSCLSLDFSNDYFNKTDRYYTQGIRLSYQHPVLTKAIDQLLPKPSNNTKIKRAVVDVFQDMYTPRDYYTTSYKPNQRPYAGVLAATYRYSQQSNEIQSAVHLNALVGVIGKHAMGEQVQNRFHDMIHEPRADGWQYQLKSGFLLNIGAVYEYYFVERTAFRFSGLMGAALGTYKDNGQLGFNIMIGKNKSFEWMPLQRVAGKFVTHQLVFQSNAYAVAYDATLQGALWQNHTYGLSADQIKRGVWNSKAEYRLLLGPILFGVSQTLQSPDFDGGLWHKWMTFHLAYWLESN